MGSNYWSCTKFADWVRGTPKIHAGTEKEWRAWENIAKKKKVRFWLAEEGLDHLQKIINWPRNLLQDARHHIDNRWISKTHALTSNLKKGQWHEFETRLLYSSFDSLVDFVEIELTRFHMACSDEAYKKYKTPWYRTVFRFSSYRNPESGMEYLNWAASLRHDEDRVASNDPDFGKPTNQALAAQETIVLYKWWKEVRPIRPDPMEASGWSDFCDKRRQKAEVQGFDLTFPVLDETEEEKAHARQILEVCHKMELEQENEDTEMLIRLIKIREHLRT